MEVLQEFLLWARDHGIYDVRWGDVRAVFHPSATHQDDEGASGPKTDRQMMEDFWRKDDDARLTDEERRKKADEILYWSTDS